MKDQLAKREDIESLSHKLWSLYASLTYSFWLTLLARNCEYGMDIPKFRELFTLGIQYVAVV